MRGTRHETAASAAALAVLSLVLSGCWGVPSPRSAEDALVIGSLVLDFPDGLDGGWSRSVRSNVLLHFVDTTTNRGFWRPTYKGYYSFLAEPAGRYLLEGFQCSLREQQVEYFIRDTLALPIGVSPGRVSYQGHLVLRYARPTRAYGPAAGSVTTREVLELPPEDEPGPLLILGFRTQTFWSYDRSVEKRQATDELLEHLRRKDSRSAWLQREIATPLTEDSGCAGHSRR